jgi:ABC-type metal ion transport system substrate-binding protein
MKVILDIEESHSPFFMELVKSLDYVNVVKEVRDKQKQKFIQDLAEAFNDVKLHEAGKKKLKTGKQITDEL